MLVQGKQKAIGALKQLQYARPVVMARERVGQARLEMLDDARPQHEIPQLPGLLVEHLLHQIVRHGPLVSGEGAYEAIGVRVIAQRERRQAEPADPPLGAPVQLSDLLVGQRQARPS